MTRADGQEPVRGAVWRRAVAVVAAACFAGCTALSPAEVPAAAAAEFAPAVDRCWPGAKAILSGLDVSGEPALRAGDRVLYGIAIARGDVVTHDLLRIEVHRGNPANDTGTLTFRGFAEERRPAIPDRVARQVELEFTLFDADGKELQRSRSEPTPDFFFEESFVRGIVAARGGDRRTQGVASARLLKIVQLLQQDPILQRLLGEVASVPFDLRLLFRRELTLVPDFAAGAAVRNDPPDPFAGALGARHDLPFDLLLNDAAFVRLSATVVDPRGPTGAAAGILMLRAQQADDPERQVRLQLLACARGPRTDWQEHGVMTSCGAVDEGLALAFSPDGRFVATPGERGVVELRDLTAADPTVPQRLQGADEPVGALAFLDRSTLLVGRGPRVEVFDVGKGSGGAASSPEVALPTRSPVRAIEFATARTCFVGLSTGEVERWVFAGDLAAPAIESVHRPAVAAATGDTPPLPFHELSEPGFLRAGDDAERVVVGWRGTDYECQRDGAGRWSATTLPPLPKGASRAARWRRADVPVIDRIGYGSSWVEAGSPGSKCFGGNLLMVFAGDKGWMVGRGHPDHHAIVHGLDPTGRYWVFVAPGYRVFVDCSRAP